MRQIIYNLKKNILSISNITKPTKGDFLIQTSCSLISKGTEKLLLDFGSKNIFSKIKSQPERVKQIRNKIKSSGLLNTYNAIQDKLEQSFSMGYCNVGKVLEIYNKNSGFKVGDRVLSNSPHAELVSNFKNTSSLIPRNVSDKDASTSILGAIALNAIRLLNPQIGNNIVVVGLGLVGNLACQILKINGVNVIGIDTNSFKVNLSKNLNITAIKHEKQLNYEYVFDFLDNKIIDGVIICSSSSNSSVLDLSADIVKKKGKIILVGVAGNNYPRNKFYEKELNFIVSSSYGPGRYDNSYEKLGLDYPVSYVRWTEKRNIDLFLNLLSNKKILVDDLIKKKFEFDNFQSAYDEVLNNQNSLGCLLTYDSQKIYDPVKLSNKKFLINKKNVIKSKKLFIGFIGTGSYARKMILPYLIKSNQNLNTAYSTGSIDAFKIAKKYNFKYIKSINSKNVKYERKDNSIFISTPHHTHFNLLIEALKSNKKIFIEKPLCLTTKELSEIKKAYTISQSNFLMVGYNRRFSKFTHIINENLKGSNRKDLFSNYNINAGKLSTDTWHSEAIYSGGRIIGELCHFIDLLLYIHNSNIIDYNVISLNSLDKESVNINLNFENGSKASINYLTFGNFNTKKENLKIYANNLMIELNDFKKLIIHNGSNNKIYNSFFQDKGQKNCINETINCMVSGKHSPIPFQDILNSTKLSIDISQKKIK